MSGNVERSGAVEHYFDQWSKRDRRHFFQIAVASGLECAACLDVLVAKRRVPGNDIVEGKQMLQRIVQMLTRMIQGLSRAPSRHQP